MTDAVFMETGQALEIVHAVAEGACNSIRAVLPNLDIRELQLALDIVEDFIVNNFEEDDDYGERMRCCH